MMKVEARTVLWYLVFIGFAVNYMIRINLNITIVEMVSNHNEVQNYSGALAFNMSDEEYNDTIFQNTNNIQEAKSRFDWDEKQQGLVLGSFFWAHWVTQIPGGILAKKYGTKLVFGLANVIGCWLCFLIPAVSHWDYRALICLRVMQGLITGLAWPAMHVMTAKWIPPNERGKFVSAYLGSSVGIAVFYPFFGYILHWTSWEHVYYVCGIIGTVWWLGWSIFVFDSPQEHPRIEKAELNYIEKSLGSSASAAGGGADSSVPWRAILTSCPVWMNVIAQWGGIWGLFTLMTQAPTYFRNVHHLDIKSTGILSGLPHLMRMTFSFIFSMYSDFLLKTNKISRTNMRKIATAICCILKGIAVIALAYFGYNVTIAIVLLTLATMLHGAVSSGPLASIVDISPNHAGIILGVSGMIGVLPGFISPYIVGLITLGNNSFEAWKRIFNICAANLIGSGVLYVCFSESTVQEWNSNDKKNTKEMEHLNTVDLEQ